MSHERRPTSDGGASASDLSATLGHRPRGEALDALFEVLADAQRRHILTYLDERDGDVATLADLRDALADGDASAGERERIATRLRHAHVPKLAAAELVEFDDRAETVRYRAGPEVSEWLELARSD